MIKISIKKENQNFKEIVISGHANYDVKGKDIVCSSVSSIVITTVNAILSFDESAINYDEDEGYLRISVLKNDEITKKLLENMESLLNELSEQYPKYIKI